MKKVVFFLFIAVTLVGFAQKKQSVLDPINLDSLNQKIKEGQAQLDSMQKRMDARFDSAIRTTDSISSKNGLDAFIIEKKERDEKQLRSLYIRGAFFAVLIALFVVNFIRNRRKKKE